MAFERFKEFNVDELVAKTPATPRDSARLMVLHRGTQKIENRVFRDITEYFKSGDCLVINNTKVFPAKIFGRKPTGGKVEILLAAPEGQDEWTALIRGFKTGMELELEDGLKAAVIGRTAAGEAILRFNRPDIASYCEKHGLMPLPVYIESARKHAGLSASVETDKERYQTVYARHQGSIAAPTAGFHFTEELLEEIKAKGVHIVYITLHVGWGTFKPLRTEPQQHQMLPELAEVTEEAARVINEAKAHGGRVFSVGTTSTRTLESFAGEDGSVSPGKKLTNLFIYEGYKFKAVDCLITNFHFPDSTPLCLVSAFAGEDYIYTAYKTAVEEKYRFYSFGDSMLIF